MRDTISTLPHRIRLFRCSFFCSCLVGLTLTVLVLSSVPGYGSGTTDSQSIGGIWRFELDRNDSGEKAGWFKRDLAGEIELPGSIQTRKLGDPRPESGPELWEELRKKGRYHMTSYYFSDYRGVVWYQKEIEIPAEWAGKPVELELERVCWASKLWVNDGFVGSQDSLSTPHRYNLGILPPGKHRLTLRVDNRPLHYLGNNTHAFHSQMQTMYNGIVGRMEIRATEPVSVVSSQIFPDTETGECRIQVKVRNTTAQDAPVAGLVRVTKNGSVIGETSKKATIPPGISHMDLTVSIPPAQVELWNEFAQPVYTATVELKTPMGTSTRSDRFAFRRFSVENRKFSINGLPVFLRGEANNAAFPLTGHPAMDKEAWKRIFQTYKDYGLNHVRFHTWTPPSEAFAAADEIGIYLQPELPNGVGAIDTKPEEVRPWLESEFERILEEYGNHPSFVMFSMGNEAKVKSLDFLSDLVRKGRKDDPRRLYSTIANPLAFERTMFEVPGDDFSIAHVGFRDGKFYPRRMESLLGGLTHSTDGDFSESLEMTTMPAVTHEVGQWYVYPDFDEIAKHTGAINPVMLDMFRASATQGGVLPLNKAFHESSGRLSLELYKEEIERALRTPGLGGFQLLGLQDYFGQGAAYVGMIDSFYDPKPFVTAKAFRDFCGPEIPLARIAKRVWKNDEVFQAALEFSNFGPAPLSNAVMAWSVKDGDRVVAEGQLPAKDYPTGEITKAGTMELPLAQFQEPRQLQLEARLGNGVTNSWKFWVYPAKEPAVPDDVLVVEKFDQEAALALEQGRRVVLLPSGFNSVYSSALVPPFWSPIYFPNYSRNLGILCDPNHPALKAFPTDSHSDWQWADVLAQGAAIQLHGTPEGFEPIVRAIDRPDRNHQIALVYETKVGPGRLLVSTLDLNRNLDKRPAARQLRASLLAYAAGPEFNPKAEIPLQGNLPAASGQSQIARMSPKVTASNEHFEGNWAHFVTDGNHSSAWSTKLDEPMPPLPHSLVIEIEQPLSVQGFTILPRQDSDLGRISQYRISTSQDGQTWTTASEGFWPSTTAEQKVMLSKPAVARFFKLEALKEVKDRPVTSVAEFDIIPAGKE